MRFGREKIHRGCKKADAKHQRVKQMMIMAYNYIGVIATCTVPHGHTVDQHEYVHFLCKILRPTIRQMYSRMLDHVIIVHGNACPHIATLVTTVFQEYNWEVLNHLPYSYNLSPLITTTYSQNSRNHSRGFVSAS